MYVASLSYKLFDTVIIRLSVYTLVHKFCGTLCDVNVCVHVHKLWVDRDANTPLDCLQ